MGKGRWGWRWVLFFAFRRSRRRGRSHALRKIGCLSFFLVGISIALLWRCPATAAAELWWARTVAEYPHDSSAFTQGLEIQEGQLYESTGRYGASSLRRVDMETGTVQQRLSLDASVFAEGITIFGERIYQLTWQNHKLFIYDAETFTLIETVPYDGEGWGLTHDDTHLILSDGTARIRFLDPETLAVAREITALDDGEPVDRLNELEYVRDEIWANIWYKNRIVRISPRDGAVLGYIDLSSLVRRSRKNDEDVLNGIAYDAASQRLFVTGKNWSTLYEIRVMAP